MSDRSRIKVKPFQLAKVGRKMSGSLAVSEFKRVVESVFDSSGEVYYELNFGIDDRGYRNICGKITAEVSVLCRRCLEKVIVPVKVDVCLGLVTTDLQADNLPERYEPLLIENADRDEYISLIDIIEDEIVLALPISSSHENDECVKGTNYTQSEDNEVETADKEGRILPFKDLGKMLKNQKH